MRVRACVGARLRVRACACVCVRMFLCDAIASFLNTVVCVYRTLKNDKLETDP